MTAEKTSAETTRWTIHEERLVDDTRKLNVSIAHVELPDGVQFEQWVLRMPKAVMTLVLDDARENVLMIYRHRWISGPGNCPAATSTRTRTQRPAPSGKQLRRRAGSLVASAC